MTAARAVLCADSHRSCLRVWGLTHLWQVLPSLLPRLSRCLKTEHSRNLEKVLHLWKDPTFVEFNKKFSKQVHPTTYMHAH